MENEIISELFARVRSGDGAAAAELVRAYEPYVRAVIRLRLTDERLRRVFDSMDLCQSVWAAFFAHAACGNLEAHTPEQLRGLLARMAINKLLDKAKSVDMRRHGGGLPEGHDAAAADETPSQAMFRADLVEAVRRRLSERECWLWDQRALGRPWEEIAAEARGKPNALRVRLSRAVARVRAQLEAEGPRDAR